jgi:hypothetical protein
MPITLNHSNISVRYNTGSNYIIETVKSDLYVRDSRTGISSNLTAEPVVIFPTTLTKVQSFTHSGGTEAQTSYTFNFPVKTLCDILIVGGGGSGDRQIGGGGGGGAVLYASGVEIPADTYTIKVGKGGENGNGGNSEAFGATCLGGGSTTFVGWGTPNNGTAGGSGSGGSPGNTAIATGGTVGTSTKGTLLNSATLYNGNIGGNGLQQNISPTAAVCGGGGGGAGTAGFNSSSTQYTTRSSWLAAGSPSKGGDGIPINITGTTYYWGAGGGGGSVITHAGDGGLGGGGGGGYGIHAGIVYPAGLAGTGGINSGGNGLNTGTENGGNGAPNTGSGGGGGGYLSGSDTYNAGNGGSGVVIIKIINDSKSYRLRVPKKTNITIVSGGITKTQFLHGIYKITITSTTTTLIKDPSMSLSGIITLNPTGQTEFTSNKIDVIYDFYKSINQINSDNTNTAASIVTNIYTDANTSGITYDYTKYNKYKISTNISKTYINASGGVNFSIYLYSNTGDIINGNNYSIRYVFHVISETDTIVPVDIYLTIKPISTGSSYTRFRVKTYSRSANGTDEAEIYAFIASGSENRNSVSINNFNNITDFNQSLSEQDVWGIVAKQGEITLLNAARVTKDNIGSKCSNGQTTTVKICDVNKLIAIKNAITSAKFTTTSPSFKENISISSSGLFPMSNVSPILNYTIGDYISYESSTQKAPADRITAFNIKDSASKYVYFAIPSASTSSTY